MASVTHLGLLPNVCFPFFNNRNNLRYRYITIEPTTETDLGPAPEEAYIKLTKLQAVSLFWRVKEWEVSWGWSAGSFSKTFNVGEDEEGNPQTVTYNHSYPEATRSKILPARHLTQFDIANVNEKQLVCNTWSGGLPNLTGGTVMNNNDKIAVSSTETNNYDPVVSLFDFSFFEIPDFVSVGFTQSRFPPERGLDFDVGWVPNDNGLLYWLYSFEISIDLNLGGNPVFGEDNFGEFGNGLPPPRGNLVTYFGSDPFAEVPPPAPTSTGFKVTIFLPDGDTIEMPLLDVTEPSPITGTRFNVNGFTGITVKPHSYWPYDPNDGDGPIYDSETGAQLRSF
jgi:hypothetical protein